METQSTKAGQIASKTALTLTGEKRNINSQRWIGRENNDSSEVMVGMVLLILVWDIFQTHTEIPFGHLISVKSELTFLN